MKSTPKRKYEMKSRAESAARTSSDIIRVIGRLWLHLPMQEITLEKVAQEAGVSVRTILRKYGSREGLFEAAMKEDAAGIQSIKDEAETGNIPQAVSVLMKEYELTGMAGIRTLAAEQEFALAGKMLRKGRKMHMQWCARVFAPYLPSSKHRQYRVMLGAYYAATDIYAWKLLRKDLHYTRQETEIIFIRTLEGLTRLTPQS